MRDHDREWAFLASTGRGSDGAFFRQATSRLDAGQDQYGDRWASVGVRRLLAEMLEEAADLGGWGALALQALDRDPSLTHEQRQRVGAALHLAARRGAEAHSAVRSALRVLDAEPER
jgi:hypothetical protein